MTNATPTAPADFAAYWQGALDELAQTPAAPEVSPLPIRDTDYATMHVVKLTSIGPYRLFAYLSIPRGARPLSRHLLHAQIPERPRTHPAGIAQQPTQSVHNIRARRAWAAQRRQPIRRAIPRLAH